MLTEIHGKYQKESGFWVVELGIGKIKVPEAVISTTLGYFAAISDRIFNQLKNSGVLRGVHDVNQTDTYIPISSQVGYANLWVIGTEEGILPAKLYRNVTVMRMGRTNLERACVGLPFVHDFDVAEFWGNGGCLRISLSQNLGEIFDEIPEIPYEKEGFYGLRNRPVIDINDILRWRDITDLLK